MRTVKLKRKTKLIASAIAIAISLVFAANPMVASATNWLERNADKKGMFDIPYDNYRDVYDDAEALHEEVVDEGTALLKNDGSLPLTTGAGTNKTRITVFNSAPGLTTALQDAGYSVNELSRAQTSSGGNVSTGNEGTHKGSIGSNGQPSGGNVGIVTEETIKPAQTASMKAYADAAVVRIYRIAGEGNDLSTGRSLIPTGGNHIENFGAITWIDENGVITAWNQADYDNGELFEAWPDGTPKGWNHSSLTPNNPLSRYSTAKELSERDVSPVRHALMLTLHEEQMIQLAKANFSTVIVVWDSITQFELWDLENDPGISAIIHSGRMTTTSVNNPSLWAGRGVARVMTGKANPSAHLVSQWDRDMTADPLWQNFGDNFQNDTSNLYLYSDGTPTGGHGRASGFGGGDGLHGIEYEEGIYLGYKYYETYWNETANGNTDLSVTAGVWSQANQDIADQWHRDHVAYPFGFGLSYATFDYEITGVYTDAARKNALPATVDGSVFASDVGSPADVKKIYVAVKVTNTSDFYAGKAVVQLYVTAPYISGGVEKSFVQIVEFDKTMLLNPRRSENMVIAFDVQDMAAFDYDNRAHASATGGYILDEGDYTIRAMSSSSVLRSKDAQHGNTYDDFTFEIDNDGDPVALRLDDYSDNLVTPIFSTPNTREYSIREAGIMATGGTGMTMISRSDLDDTFPKAPTVADRKLNDRYIDDYVRSEVSYLAGYSRTRAELGLTTAVEDYNAAPANAWYANETKGLAVGADYTYFDNARDPWYMTRPEFEAIATDWTQVSQAGRDANPWAPIQLKDMAGVPLYVYDEVTGEDSINPQWDAFMNGMTLLELRIIASNGNTDLSRIDPIGKNYTSAHDNTSVINNMYHWGDQPLLARTYNKRIAAEHGKLTACYAAFGITWSGGSTSAPTGWWSPGANLQRSPFSGRNADYYGQDSLTAGIFTSHVTAAAEEFGLACWIKHPMLNDQETNRNGYGLFTWADEQTMRENYFPNTQKPYQEGKASGAMQSFARIGGVVFAYSYEANTELYRNQWGWTGVQCTDMLGGQVAAAYAAPEKPAVWLDAGADASGTAGNKDKLLDQTKKWLQGRTVTLDQLVRGATGVPDANNSRSVVHTYDAAGENIVGIVNTINTVTSRPNGATSSRDNKDGFTTTSLSGANSNAASGLWAAGMRNGKGGVYLEHEGGWDRDLTTINNATTDMTVSAYHQWYGVRMTAMYACYESANCRGNQNGMLTENKSSNLRFYHASTQNVTGLVQGTAATVSVDLKTVTKDRQDEGDNKIVYTIKSGALPAGLTLNAATGKITGTPTTATAADSAVVIECRVANYLSGTHTATFKPIAAAVTLGAGNGVVGTAFSRSVESILAGTKTYSIADGALPTGLSITSAGVISGTPLVAGTFNFTVKVAIGSASYLTPMSLSVDLQPIFSEATIKGWIDAATASKLDTAAVNALITAAMDANAKGFLTNATATTLINSVVDAKGYQTAGQVTTAISAAMDANAKGFLTNATATTLINSLVDAKGYQNATQVTSAISTAMDANAKGFLTNATATTLINSMGFQTATDVNTIVNGKGFQTASQVTTAISTAMEANAKGFLDQAAATTLINSVVGDKGYQIASQVTAAINAAMNTNTKGFMTEAEVTALINAAIEANNKENEGCGSAISAGSIAIFGLAGLVFVGLRIAGMKRKANQD